MSQKSILSRLEIILGILLFLIFSFWTVRKCNAVKEKYRQEAEIAEAEDAPEATTPADSVRSPPAKPESPPAPAPINTERHTPLYVTIEGLNMRAEPKLNSQIITRLALYEEVEFLNEVTTFRDSINLGSEMVYEPWVKVRQKKGHTGWVYGAGVHYYKTKRAGVE